MGTFRAVEFMRKVRDDLDKKYSGLSLEERLKRTHKEMERSELWKNLSQRPSQTTSL